MKMQLALNFLITLFSSKSVTSTIVVKAPQLGSGGEAFSTLVDDVLHFIAELDQVSISHIWREGNRCADWIASFGPKAELKDRVWLCNSFRIAMFQ